MVAAANCVLLVAFYAATFGNVHGVYKPGNVKLRPEILKRGQRRRFALGKDARHQLVFHGGSGSELSRFTKPSIWCGKMISILIQYAYTRAVVDHMFKL